MELLDAVENEMAGYDLNAYNAGGGFFSPVFDVVGFLVCECFCVFVACCVCVCAAHVRGDRVTHMKTKNDEQRGCNGEVEWNQMEDDRHGEKNDKRCRDRRKSMDWGSFKGSYTAQLFTMANEFAPSTYLCPPIHRCTDSRLVRFSIFIAVTCTHVREAIQVN